MFRDCGKKTGIIEKCTADSKTTFEVFEGKKNINDHENREGRLFSEYLTNPGFVINRLPTYLNKAVIPEYFVFHFIYAKGCFGMKFLPDSFNSFGWPFVAGIIPVGIMGSLYYKIVYRLWFTDHQATEVSQRALLRCRRRMTKMVLSVTAVYAVCWVSEHMIYFLGFLKVLTFKTVPRGVAFALVVFNSSIKPVIYSFQSGKFQRHVWSLVCCRRHFNRLVYPRQN